MARTPAARVKPELLRWARKSAGFPPEVAAKKIGVRPERLLSWEAGEATPSIAQLRKAANVYKRPLAVFFLPEVPRTFEAMRDFRRIPSDEELRELSPELRLAIRDARARREVALDLLREAGEELSPPSLPTQNKGSVAVLAQAARDLLGIPLEEQLGWREKYRALRGWTSAVEGAGVLIFQTTGIAMAEMRGFSISDPPLPVIVVNAKDSPLGRIFTILHEFAHVLLNNGGLCDLGDAEGKHLSEEQRTEVFCNQVAAEILVPSASLLSDVGERSREVWQDEVLAELSTRYSVSREVVLRRLLTLGLATEHFYRVKRQEFLRAYARQTQQEIEHFPFYRIKVRDLGRSYLGIVLDAYHREAITSADLSEYLGLQVRHVPRLEREAFG